MQLPVTVSGDVFAQIGGVPWRVDAGGLVGGAANTAKWLAIRLHACKANQDFDSPAQYSQTSRPLSFATRFELQLRLLIELFL